MDLSIAYQNGAFIPDSDAYPDRWSMAAQEWREIESAVGRARLNLPYGPGERQKMDIFYPAGRPAGLVVFVYGGYWRAFDRKIWSHLAAGSTQRDWAFALPSYTLAPDARISEITREISSAITKACEVVAGSVVLAGHSAGGHLAARMVCKDVTLPDQVAKRLQRVVPISPVSDLRPLLDTDLNVDLHLDPDEAVSESPALNSDIRDVPVDVWVGAEERPAFLDQARWLSEAWANTTLNIAPGLHHFDVIDGLQEPDSPLMNALLK